MKCSTEHVAVKDLGICSARDGLEQTDLKVGTMTTAVRLKPDTTDGSFRAFEFFAPSCSSLHRVIVFVFEKALPISSSPVRLRGWRQPCAPVPVR